MRVRMCVCACVPFLSCVLINLFSLEPICHPVIQHHCPRDDCGVTPTRLVWRRERQERTDAGKRRVEWRRDGGWGWGVKAAEKEL